MARPIVGDVRTKLENRKLKNGNIYVYQRVVKYDPETRTNKTLSRTLLGMKKPGSDEIVETRPRTRRTVNVESTTSDGKKGITRKKIGLLSLLDWIGEASSIDEDLKTAFGDNSKLATKCLNIVRYWVATNGETLPNMRTWQIKHGLSTEEQITENDYKEIFDTIGQNEKFMQNYFKCRCHGLEKGNVIAIDSTTTSTYSTQIDSARYGFNKDCDGLPTIKTLTLYSLDANQPLAFYHQPGNIPDVISIKNALKELDYLNISKPLIVADNGFYSNDNVCAFLQEHIKFLMRVTIADGSWIKKLVDEHVNELQLMLNQIASNYRVRGITIPFTKEFKYTCKYNTDAHKAGDTVTFSRRLYLHVYMDCDKHFRDTKLFEAELESLKSRLIAGEELNPAAQKLAAQCLTVTTGRGGKITVVPNQAGVNERSKYFGLLLLLTNKESEKDRSFTTYRKREHIEDHYEKLKNIADGSKPRVWDSWRFKGRQFVQFVCLGYFDFMYKKIRELKYSLGQITGDPIHDLDSNIKEEKQVKSWLQNKSLHEIFNWFDCLELVNLCGGRHPQVTQITEQIKRDLKFLEVIGYKGVLSKG